MRGYSCIGLFNTKDSKNIGGAMRAAYCYESSLIIISGNRYKYTPDDTSKAYRTIPLIQTNDLFNSVPYDCKIIGVEITEKSKNIINFIHPERACYIFGPEDGSLPDEVLNKCNYVISIPTKHCMNLAATVNVVLYDRLIKAKI